MPGFLAEDSMTTEIERIEARMMQRYQDELRLSNTILDSFLNMGKGSPLTYLLARAASEAADAMDELSRVEPDNLKRIIELQADISRKRDLVRWINDAVASGKEAWRLLNADERGELIREVADSYEVDP
jgi:hypothetical protein